MIFVQSRYFPMLRKNDSAAAFVDTCPSPETVPQWAAPAAKPDEIMHDPEGVFDPTSPPKTMNSSKRKREKSAMTPDGGPSRIGKRRLRFTIDAILGRETASAADDNPPSAGADDVAASDAATCYRRLNCGVSGSSSKLLLNGLPSPPLTPTYMWQYTPSLVVSTTQFSGYSRAAGSGLTTYPPHHRVHHHIPSPLHHHHPGTDHESGGARSKRVRTVFTSQQIECLEREFSKQHYMVGTERYYLARQLNLNEAQVKVWFQNRRIKWRKQRLQQPHATTHFSHHHLHNHHQPGVAPAASEVSAVRLSGYEILRARGEAGAFS